MTTHLYNSIIMSYLYSSQKLQIHHLTHLSFNQVIDDLLYSGLNVADVLHEILCPLIHRLRDGFGKVFSRLQQQTIIQISIAVVSMCVFLLQVRLDVNNKAGQNIDKNRLHTSFMCVSCILCIYYQICPEFEIC